MARWNGCCPCSDRSDTQNDLLLRTILPPLGVLLLAMSTAAAQGVLVDKSDIRFVAKQMGVNVEGRFASGRPMSCSCRRRSTSPGPSSTSISRASTSRAPSRRPSSRAPHGSIRPGFPVPISPRPESRIWAAASTRSPGRSRSRAWPRPAWCRSPSRTDAAGNRVAEGKFSLKRLDYRVGEGLWADTDTVANDVIVSVASCCRRR